VGIHVIELRLLGQFDLHLDGLPVVIPSRPAQSLLAYLALTVGIAHRRERLAGLIWPDIPEADARRNLRRALWHIRKALEGQAPLRADDITIAFDDGSKVWVDAQVISQKINFEWTKDQLAQVVSAYGGELLPGFYDEWIIVERERLQSAFEARIKLLLERLLEDQRWEEVFEWAEKWVALAGAAEPAYRALMVAYAEQGDLSGVGHTYQRCSEALSRDLGLEPSDETVRLFQQLSQPAKEKLTETRSLQSRRGASEQPVSSEPAGRVARTAKTSPAIEPDEPSSKSPFKGLQFFDEADADLFFGREALTSRLLSRLGILQGSRSESDNLLVIIGASGSGKSSLVRAGLVSAVRQTAANDGVAGADHKPNFEIEVITPTAQPLETLATRLTRQAESVTAAATLLDDMRAEPRSLRLYLRKASSPLFLVVDQMEELFTLCRQESERQAFVDNLLNAAEGGHCKIVLVLRADFYAHCAQYENLRTALAARQEYIGPMTTAELRRAIQGPAELSNFTFEPGLVDLILREVGSEPGALPLLSHALLETWRRRQGRTLTLAGYAETGGVHGAIAHTAETLYLHLTPRQQRIARNIFLRLTELGEGVQDTRRRVAPEELALPSEDPTGVEEVLNVLAEARLVTVSEDSVEVAHEALIREWPTLRAWLAEDREALLLHRHLTEAARSWQELDCDPGELYRGARLAQASDRFAAYQDQLNDLERDFLTASLAQSQQEAAEREAAQQRETEAVQRFAESEQRRAEEQSRTAQRFRWLAAGLALLLLAAVALANLAWQQRNNSDVQTRLATSRELAASAISNLEVDPERSILLGLEAAKLADTKEAIHALHLAVQTSRLRRTFQLDEEGLLGVAYSRDGKQFATGGADGSVRIWDSATGKPLATLTGHSAMINYVAFNPDGSRLATASDDGTAKVWDPRSGKEILTFRGHDGFVTVAKFSPDGKQLVTAGEDGTIRLWEADSGKALHLIRGHSQIIRDLSVSPDGSRLVTGSDDQTARVWDTNTGRSVITLSGHTGPVYGVDYSPDGKYIATVSEDGTVKLWDAFSGNVLQSLTGHTNIVQGVAFSPDGERLATGGYDGRVIIWSIPDGKELFSLSGRPVLVFRVAFSPDGSQVASANSDGTAQLWDVSPGKEHLTLTGHQASIFSINYSPDGKRLVSASGDGTAAIWDSVTGQALVWLRGHESLVLRAVFNADGSRVATASDDMTARIWDASSGEELVTLAGHAQGPGTPFVGVMDVAFSPDDTRLATAGADSTIIIWDVASGRQLMQLTGHTDRVNSIAYSPDGTRLASASDDQTIKIWDTVSGKEIMTLDGHTARVWRVVFSPDGTRLASGSTDATVILWDVQTGEQQGILSGHTSTVFTVVFSEQADRLASASVDGTVKIWDAQSGEELLTLTDHHTAVRGAAFSPDGSLLATSGDSGLVRINYLKLQDLISLANTLLTRRLSESECQQYLHADTCPEAPYRVFTPQPLP
jgi:WD40 repeat protein/DNA-binding SARP family transcriptional activator